MQLAHQLNEHKVKNDTYEERNHNKVEKNKQW